MGEMSETTPAMLPPVPRPLTPAAKRRAWAEPTVRFGWLATLAVIAVTLGVAIDNYLTWARQRALIVQGTPVQATIVELGGVTRVARMAPDTPVVLTYDIAGVPQRVEGILEGRTDWLTTRQIVPIRVDPAEPTRWTYATEVPSLAQYLAMALLLLPLVAILVVATLWLRARALSLWRNGAEAAAVVASSRQTPLAPRSTLVQCALADGPLAAPNDAAVIDVYVPRRLAKPVPGDRLLLIVDPAKPRRAILADAYA